MTQSAPGVPQVWLDRMASVSAPSILLSLDYRVLAANDAYLQRYPVSLALGEDRCHSVSHGYATPCDQNGEACPMRLCRQSGATERVFHVHRCGDHPEHVDVTLEPLRDAQGELSAFLETIRPVSVASAHPDGAFVGSSKAFARMLELIQRAACSEVPVLLLGESGTGKELAAHAIHRASHRADGPFVPVECSGLSESLFESELFGHVQGAFTGASRRKIGLVEAAAGGTLFLDEVGDVPLNLQVKLLRLLEAGSYRVVGDIESRRADFRLVCATHRDLAQMVEEGRFRADLFYRINTFPIGMPALRERLEDLPPLCEALLRGSGKTLSSSAMERLARHPFPGNVRELRNLLERALLMADQDVLEPRHLGLGSRDPVPLARAPSREPELPLAPAPSQEPELPPAPQGPQPPPQTVAHPSAPPSPPFADSVMPLAEVEARYLTWALQHHEGDRASLARKLGLSQRTLYRKLQTIRRHPAPDGS